LLLLVLLLLLLLGVMMMVPVVRVLMVVRRHLVPAHRRGCTGHVVTRVLLVGHGCGSCRGRRRRSGLLVVAPVLGAAAALRSPAPVLLPRRFVRRRGRVMLLFAGTLRRPVAGLLRGHRARPAGRLTFADGRVFRRFVVLVLREPTYLGGPERLMEVRQPAVGLPALAVADEFAVATCARHTSTSTSTTPVANVRPVTVVDDFVAYDGREPVNGLFL